MDSIFDMLRPRKRLRTAVVKEEQWTRDNITPPNPELNPDACLSPSEIPPDPALGISRRAATPSPVLAAAWEPLSSAQKPDSIDSSGSPFPDGVKVLHDCPNAVVDICFVHGLTGDRENTWTAEGQAASWPGILLPQKLSGARILTYGYDAYVARHKRAPGVNRLVDHATNLLHDLVADRACCNTSRPLILVAHSLGGLVCKKAILLSRDNPEPHLRNVFDSTKGIIFMGTPHKGSWLANWAKMPASAISFIKSTNKSLLEVLETSNEVLETLQVDFLGMIRQQREGGRLFEITCFFEELPMPIVGTVVSKESATLEGFSSMTIHGNHREMVRFASTEDNGFKRVLGELNRWKSQLSKET
ncbi:uncharacterized protein DNG_05912 [Cephalotrichum gorgonifer]|uniref:DUF676 domain-containing protein n=1 Tax=Cephalotrichum gorgonifer TaxID=2041049 RepID=A0AAE8MZ10_9PEZI|nr:uncharacterized protein DNG_05912 [Cephalotrichum gorgonifer]